MTNEPNNRGLRLRLHWKILLYSSALLVTLIVAMLVYVRAQAASFVSGRLAEDLERGSERIRAAENEEMSDLHLMAALVASIPQLNALLGTVVCGAICYKQVQDESPNSRGTWRSLGGPIHTQSLRSVFVKSPPLASRGSPEARARA